MFIYFSIELSEDKINSFFLSKTFLLFKIHSMLPIKNSSVSITEGFFSCFSTILRPYERIVINVTYILTFCLLKIRVLNFSSHFLDNLTLWPENKRREGKSGSPHKNFDLCARPIKSPLSDIGLHLFWHKRLNTSYYQKNLSSHTLTKGHLLWSKHFKSILRWR